MPRQRQRSFPLYLPTPWTDEDVATFVQDVTAVAEHLGYTVERGSTAGRGNIRKLLEAIALGELALVLLAEEQKLVATDYLRRYAAELKHGGGVDWIAATAFGVIAEALAATIEREGL